MLNAHIPANKGIEAVSHWSKITSCTRRDAYLLGLILGAPLGLHSQATLPRRLLLSGRLQAEKLGPHFVGQAQSLHEAIMCVTSHPIYMLCAIEP